MSRDVGPHPVHSEDRETSILLKVNATVTWQRCLDFSTNFANRRSAILEPSLNLVIINEYSGHTWVNRLAAPTPLLMDIHNNELGIGQLHHLIPHSIIFNLD